MRGVLDRHGRPIRPYYWFHHTVDMCDVPLAQGDWRSGRTECKRKATVSVKGGKARICGWHAARIRRGIPVYIGGSIIGTIKPEDLNADRAPP